MFLIYIPTNDKTLAKHRIIRSCNFYP
uniref:Uncharacterized protein n=1 Tax=Arundo donax TaxID=35708 RepID=A0A0A8Z8S8_ARUDO